MHNTYYSLWLAEHGYTPLPTGTCECENGAQYAEDEAARVEREAEQQLLQDELN